MIVELDMTSWEEIGHRAFVEIFNAFVDQKQTPEITTLVDKTISSYSENMGFACSTTWELDLPVEAVLEVMETIAKRTVINDDKNISSFVYAFLTEKLNGSLNRIDEKLTCRLRDNLLKLDL